MSLEPIDAAARTPGKTCLIAGSRPAPGVAPPRSSQREAAASSAQRIQVVHGGSPSTDCSSEKQIANEERT